MKIIIITGNHPRHLFFLNSIHKKYPLSGMILQRRENIIPDPDKELEQIDKENFIKHFQNRQKTEASYFDTPTIPSINRLDVTDESLNSEESAKFVKKINPDVVLIFGTNLIKDPLFSILPRHAINLHLGLSPRYRGSATLFWPFYFMEPSYAGSTFHYIIEEPDAGNIIHQSIPQLEIKDGIHDVACKTVIQSSKDIIKLLEIFERHGRWKIFKQKGTGKNFLDSDFKPQHLRVVYNIFNDQLVREYLSGNLSCKIPRLFRQF